jgi:hypothetical protein
MLIHLLNVNDKEKRIYEKIDFCIVLVLVKYIRNEEKMDCVVEAFRVLGNLSRAKKIRDILMKCKG